MSRREMPRPPRRATAGRPTRAEARTRPPANALRALNGNLTVRETRFVQEYLVDLNAGAAAVRAGYARRGADVQGHWLLRRESVAAAIQARMRARQERLEIRADEVLRSLVSLVRSDIRDVTAWGKDGVSVHPSAGLTPEQAGAIAEVSEGPQGRLRVKMYDKVAALTLLMRHLNMFPSTRIVHDPETGRTGIEVPGGAGGAEEPVVIYIPDNGRPPGGNLALGPREGPVPGVNGTAAHA